MNATRKQLREMSAQLQVGTVFCADIHDKIDQLPYRVRQAAWVAVISYAQTRLAIDFQEPPKRSVLARLFDWPVRMLGIPEAAP